MRKYKVLFGTSYVGNDTTSFLRASGPFSLMRDSVEIVRPILTYRKASKIEELTKEAQPQLDLQAGWWNNWESWRGVDVCFLHRPFGLIGGAIVNACKIHGVKLWVDHDDDLINIPETNPHFKIHNDGEKIFPGFEYSIKEADILTCSGKVMLKDFHEKYKRRDARLITTGLDDELVRFKRPFTPNNKISWRGSTSHKRDLEVFKTVLERVGRDCPKRWWFWAGIDVREIFGKDLPFEGEYSPIRNHYMFLDELCKINSSIHIVPLEDNKFNRVKSNLAWLDATLAGSAVIGPEFEEWQCPGILNYGISPSSFKDTLMNAIDNSYDLKGFHDESWEYIKENLLTSKLNLQRLEILNEIGYRKI